MQIYFHQIVGLFKNNHVAHCLKTHTGLPKGEEPADNHKRQSFGDESTI